MFTHAAEELPQDPPGTRAVVSDVVGVGSSHLAFRCAVYFTSANSGSNHFLKISAMALIREEQQERIYN